MRVLRDGLNTKALGVFRVLIGLISGLGFFERIGVVGILYSNTGVLPLSVARVHHHPASSFLVTFWNDESWYQKTILWFGVLLSLLFMMGKGARWTKGLLLYFLYSVQIRNEWTLYGADQVLRVFFFWSIFLPVETPLALKNFNLRNTPFVFGFALQLLLMYWFGIFFKLQGPWITGGGIASGQALQQPDFTTPLGVFLSNQVMMFPVFSWVTLIIEMIGPAMIFFGNRQARNAGVFLLIAFHVLLGLIFRLGWFSPVCIAVIAAFFVPSKIDAKGPIRSIRLWVPVGAILGWVMIWNAAILGWIPSIPKWFETVGKWTGIEQEWGMYANPGNQVSVVRFNASLKNGRSVPLALSQIKENFRGRLFLLRTMYLGNEFSEALAQYLCRIETEEQGLGNPGQIDSIEVYSSSFEFSFEEGKVKKNPPHESMIWSHSCVSSSSSP